MATYNIYAIDKATIKGIKKGEIEAVNKFYFDNISMFKKNARKFLFVKHCQGCTRFEFDDLMQQIYVSIPDFNFESDHSIFRSVRHCFYTTLSSNYYDSIDIAFLRSLDSPLSFNDGEENICLSDVIMGSAGADVDLITVAESLAQKKQLVLLFNKLCPKNESLQEYIKHVIRA